MANVTNNAISAAFRTLIVPMKLPPEPDDSDDILEYLEAKVVDNQQLSWPNDEVRKLTKQFCWLHKASNFSATNIKSSLTNTSPGQVCAFYLKAQNAVLNVHRLLHEPEMAEVYAWAAQLPPDDILKTVDEPLRQRIPESAVRVKFHQLTDTFPSLIYDLGVNHQPEALPKTWKAGEDVVEERDTIHPKFVTEWLVRALGGSEVPSNREQGNALLKKVRDEAHYGNGRLLWRRCPIWFALRSSAHFTARLTIISQQQVDADLLFKLWMLDVLGTLYSCGSQYHHLEQECGRSAMLEGARKIARRVEKLKKTFSEDRRFHHDAPQVQRRCEVVVQRVMEFLKADSVQLDEPVLACVKLSENQVQEGLVHKLKHSWGTLQRLKNTVDNGSKQGSSAAGLPPAMIRLRDLNMSDPDYVDSFTQALTDAKDAPRKTLAALSDVRDNVMREWKNPSQLHYDACDYCESSDLVSALSESLLKLLRTNLEMSAKFGQGDIRIESLNTVLINVTIVLMLDRLNCALFPMLKEHKLGLPVNRDEFLNTISLAQRSEKEHLLSLEQYILKRNGAARCELVSKYWQDGSFPTRFASKCSYMCQVLSQIQTQCRQNEKNKLAEYSREQNRYDDLARQVNSSSCTCYYNDDGYYVTRYCNRCSWKEEMDGINIFYYERLLPPSVNDQWAVVYELTEPTPLSCLREAIFMIATNIIDNPDSVSTQWGGTLYDWKADDVLQTWSKSRSCPLQLSSWTKKWCNSHYNSHHITCHDSFVVNCAKKCVQSLTYKGKPGFVEDCSTWSWSLLKKCRVRLHQPRYKALQKYIYGWQHNENQVLCDKSEAHRDKKVASANIPLTEFEAIGKLRTGHFLQLESFLECMSQRSVSFQEEDVVTTSMALLWQVAPNATGTWFRDVWRRIASSGSGDSDAGLVVDCANHAKDVLEDAHENWCGHNVLLVVTLFLRAVFEHIPLSEENGCGRAKQEVAKVLQFSRKIAKKWVEKICEANDRCTEEVEIQKLLATTASVASTGVLTFLNHSLLMTNDDVADFLHLRAVAHDNLAVEALRQHSWQRQHHLHADASAEAVLQRIHDLIQANPNCLDAFLKLHWTRARNNAGFQTSWHRHRAGAASDSWYHSEFSLGSSQPCKVEIDVLGGLFLIDGKPCQRLPESITSHKIYARLFGPSVFAVQPDGCGGFSTKSKVQGATFTFREPCAESSENPEIEELRNGINSILVPNETFVSHNSLGGMDHNDFPRIFINDYSHWITQGSKLYFRPKSYIDDTFKSFSPDQGLDYVLDLETRLTMQKDGCCLLDISSDAHMMLFTSVFNRACVQPDLHVFARLLSDGIRSWPIDKLAQVVVPRLQNHRFDVLKISGETSSNPICATDYRNLLVAQNQNYGTLLGLKHGLLLEGLKGSNKQFERRVLLMPHGKVKKVSKSETTIDLEHLRKPAFFKYELRDELQDLHPSKSRQSTTYLALLHATTSGLFPDPFLGCTGTQKAMFLLRSGRCCGNLATSMEDTNRVLEHETKTLIDISRLSPARQFYPPNLKVMETVSWPSSIEPLCAHNAYAFLAKQRIDDMSNTLNLVCQDLKMTDRQNEIIQLRTDCLSKRALLTKSLPLCPMDCNMDAAEFGSVFGTEKVLRIWTIGQGMRYTNMAGFNNDVHYASSVVGHCGQNGRVGATDMGLVKNLLQLRTLEKLDGQVPSREGIQTGEVASWANVITNVTAEEHVKKHIYTEFHNIWVSLYNIARRRDTWKSSRGRKRFAFLLTFLAQRYPAFKDHLVQLLAVSENGAMFVHMDPPEYCSYQKPAEDQYVESAIGTTVEHALETFTESSPSSRARHYTSLRRQWEERRDTHSAGRRASKNEIMSNVRNAWRGRRNLINNEVIYHKVTSSSVLLNNLNTRLTNWRRSEELSSFTKRFSEALMNCQNQASLRPLSSVGPIAPVGVSQSAVDNFSVQIQLITTKTNVANSSVCGLGSLRTLTAPEIMSQFIGCRSHTTSENVASVPPCPLTLDDVVMDDEYREMAEDSLTKLERSWHLAHSKGDSLPKLLMDGLQVTGNKAILKNILTDELTVSSEAMESAVVLMRNLEKGPSMLESTGLWNNNSIAAILSKFPAEVGGKQPIPTAIPTIVQLRCKLGIAIRQTQRATRCLRLLDQGHQVYARLARELQNVGSCGWDPYINPEWLLLEVDNDFCVREHQAQVARVFLSNEMTNQLLQQNMGEGKTDVIVPMIMAYFGAAAQRNHGQLISDTTSNPDADLCCVTVLNSLYPSNTSTWQWRIGGLVNQRVYPMLFRRDLALGKSEAAAMLSQLKYIANNGHVVVTVPEQRLSLENKVIELACSKAVHANTNASEALLEVQRFLKDRSRNFLDESDMILSPLYQLVYTMGDPVDMDGGVLRWSVAAAALQSVSGMAAELQVQFQDRHLVEVHLNEKPGFSSVRLLDGDGTDEVWDFIRRRVLDDVMATGAATKHLEVRPRLLPLEREQFRSMVLDHNVDTRAVHFGENSSTSSASTTCKNLTRLAEILRGLLTHDALRFALGKRWRVDYGAHPSRLSYLMAVPYRYKDVAAERTEFKHPDVMLLHTLQHFYQHGLLPNQLREVFLKLGNMAESQGKALFNAWAGQSVQNCSSPANQNIVPDRTHVSGISHATSQRPKPFSDFRPVLDYTNVNPADAAQFQQQLMPQFQHHVEAIDFFLFRKVFPVQAKEFPHEIAANSWDLCPIPHGDARHADSARNPTRGFSGTDGLQPVLPATVTQKNLPSGEIANGLQMISLVNPDNNEISVLPGSDANAAEKILDLLADEDRVNMVLDPGALILEMGTHQFAKAWLVARADMEAVVFFDSSDKECLISQTNQDEPVERVGSPYADDLSRCLIYLDDVHTRGVDFLLPLHSRAILTLGTCLDKDKLMQAAMRLRQLGPGGQSLHFVASAEVGEALEQRGVQPNGNCAPNHTNIHPQQRTNSALILAWALSNTVKKNCDLLTYYAAQGADHLRRCRAFAALSSAKINQDSLQTLADEIVQSENLCVSNMYGAARAPKLVKNVVSHLFRDFSDSAHHHPEEISLMNKVLTHVQTVVPSLQRLQSNFGQEMERELEQELEEEIHVEKPPPAKPVEPRVSKFIAGALSGGMPTTAQEVYPLHLGALTHTTLNEMAQGQFESTKIWVTRDFCRTIKATHAQQDGYTKTPRWILVTENEQSLVIVSNFEAEFVAKNYPNMLGNSGYPRMHIFSPLRRLRQPRYVLTRDLSFEAPRDLHVYAGSIQPRPNSHLFDQMRLYMGLVPHNIDRSRCSLLIERDGFVPPSARREVVQCYREVDWGGLENSPFSESPVRLLIKLYSNIYGLGEELETSIVGKLLGAAELGGY